MTIHLNDERLEQDPRRARECELFAERQAIVEIARPWFEVAVRGDKHSEMAKPLFHVPDHNALHSFAEALIIARDHVRQKKMAADPKKSKAAKQLRSTIKIFKQMAVDERNAAACIGVAMTGKLRETERRIKDLEEHILFCCPESLDPILALADAAQRAWEYGWRWDAESGDWVKPNVPGAKNADGPVAHVVVKALAFIDKDEKRSRATVVSVIARRRR